ncbi:Heparinase II/III-like protein [Paenibacillus konkukensis]|uniref:Heparinase II/III-like protein n=1 Tax=Paenibacillus konkukensis TaxID=2020716 RepID=A0ABY4RP75_9BACL|nr:heparinase II/III family protein [Paenibacillus konkukensis]UQZ83795.1 Heparinase II/III-like protein [Paenibacillus konkukensis]
MIKLSELFGAEELGAILLSRDSCRPYPDAEQRDEWEKLPPELRRSVIAEGERYLGCAWPALTATMYREFLQNGNRTRYDGPYHLRRRAVTSLALAECVENEGRFMNDLIDGIWLISEESNWVISAHNRMFQGRYPDLPDAAAQPGIDLFAAETGNLFAWLHYLLRPAFDRVNPLIGERLLMELRRRILDPYLQRDDCWWMGLTEREKRLNNWTPWCTSNCLSAFLLAEEDGERRLQAVRKALAGLDRYLSMHPADGGCDEGPGYWNKAGGSLFDCLELLYTATGGQFNVYDEPLIQNIGRYIYKVHIHDRYYLNFADGPHRITVEEDVVYRFGKRIGDDNMMALGTAVHQMLRTDGWKNMKFLSFLRVLPALFHYDVIENDRRPLTYRRDMWMDGIQVMAARETDSPDRGLYAAMKGGHNQESHNHNDVGHFVVYADGLPVLIDVGVEEYTAKTFSSERYDIWTMQSGYHSLPTLNGSMQRDGREYRASSAYYEASAEGSQLTLDIASAYPPEAGVVSWRRRCRLERMPQPLVELEERYAFADSAACRFTLHFMTCCLPDADNAGVMAFYRDGRKALVMEYDAGAFTASAEAIALEDKKLRNSWGEKLYRIVLTPVRQEREGGHIIRFRQP